MPGISVCAPLRRLGLAGLWLLLLGATPMPQPNPQLLLPDSRRGELTYSQGRAVWIQLNPQRVEQVLLAYLRLSRQPDWRLTYPAEAEAVSWLAALKKSGESKVFMLNLYHLKTKVNYVLTIGEISDTSQISARTIITIYSMNRPFGR